MPPSRATNQYPGVGRPAMPTIGCFSCVCTSVPQLVAPPNGNTVPSVAVTQYPEWFFWATHACGAWGGPPAGPAYALTPLRVPINRRPSAADGDAKCGTALIAMGNPLSTAP